MARIVDTLEKQGRYLGADANEVISWISGCEKTITVSSEKRVWILTNSQKSKYLTVTLDALESDVSLKGTDLDMVIGDGTNFHNQVTDYFKAVESSDESVDTWLDRYRNEYFRVVPTGRSNVWMIRYTGIDKFYVQVTVNENSATLIGDQPAKLNTTVASKAEFQNAVDTYYSNWRAPPYTGGKDFSDGWR